MYPMTIGQNVFSDEQLFEEANELIKPLNRGFEIESRKDINNVLKKIEAKEDTVLLEQINFFTKVWESLAEIDGVTTFCIIYHC